VARGWVAETSSMPSTELRLFAAAMAVETAHLVDDGLIDPHDGATDLPSTLISVAIAVVAVTAYGRLARPARAILAGVFGLAGLLSGLDMHVIPALQHGATGGDYTGFGQAAAGAVLVTMAAVLALRPAAGPQPA
jgi:hypothetical protein